MATSKTQVRLEVDGDQAAVTFVNDSGLNVLTADVMHTLGAAVARVKRDPAVRTLVVQAEGKCFLAGADVNSFANYSAEDARRFASLGQDVLEDLAGLRCVTIAAINGAALASGFDVALACDFRVAVRTAKLGFPEVLVGLIPALGGIQRLTRLIGPAKAKRLYLTGHQISAEEGYDMGLIDEVVNSLEDLRARVATFCRSFRKAAPGAVALAKRASRDLDDISAFVECFHSRECREGLAAFLRKQPAPWTEGGGG